MGLSLQPNFPPKQTRAYSTITKFDWDVALIFNLPTEEQNGFPQFVFNISNIYIYILFIFLDKRRKERRRNHKNFPIDLYKCCYLFGLIWAVVDFKTGKKIDTMKRGKS